MTDINDDLRDALEQRAQEIRDEKQAAAAAASHTPGATWLETAFNSLNENN